MKIFKIYTYNEISILCCNFIIKSLLSVGASPRIHFAIMLYIFYGHAWIVRQHST